MNDDEEIKPFETTLHHETFDDDDDEDRNILLMEKFTSSSSSSPSSSSSSSRSAAAAATTHPHRNHKIPYVTYTALHEKLINFVVFLIAKHSHLANCLFRSFLVLILLIPFFYLAATGKDAAIAKIWLPCAIFLVLCIMVVVPCCMRERTWETMMDDDDDGDDDHNHNSHNSHNSHNHHGTHYDNFYEASITNHSPHPDTDRYTPRPIEELYYTNGLWKTTSTNQIIRFRGVNLPAKTPTYGHTPSLFYKAKKDVSFLDTPIPLKYAHEHFQRLSLYGFNLLRLIVTWEAVMHEGPGIIDTSYLTYLSSLIDIASQYGLYVIIDPHQDVWSRFTGGDGAPWWTLDAVGLGVEDDRIHQSGSAFLDHLRDEKDPKPKMIWTTNYGKVATATMFTLFFAGDVYAPGIYVDEKYCPTSPSNRKEGEEGKWTLQQFLQMYYLQYFDVLASLVKDKPNVIGFNSMNEPSNGYVGIENLTKRTYAMPFGYSLNYFDGMKLGTGQSIECQYFSAPFYYHSRKIINPNGISAWKTPDHDLWQRLGVYSTNPNTGEVQLHRENYFSLRGKDFMEEYMVPLFEKIQQTITNHNPRLILFAEPFIDVNDHQHPNAPLSLDENKYAWAPHWYDGSTLMLRRYLEWFALDDERKMPVVTKRWIDATFQRILGHIKDTGNHKLHVVLGEVGVPFDMPSNDGNFEKSTKALDRTMRAMEANDLDFTLWNYYPKNTIRFGDDWCGEDLSVRMENRNRALLALVRPFVYKISPCYEIITQRFDPSKHSKRYHLTVKQSGSFDGATSNNGIFIYLPHLHYKRPLINTSFGNFEMIDKKSQLLIWDCSGMKIGRQAVLTIQNSA